MLTFSQVIKDQPGVGDVHVATALGNRKTRRARRRLRRKIDPVDPAISMIKSDDAECAFSITVPILKYDDALNTVYGWASVNTERGEIVTDHQDYFRHIQTVLAQVRGLAPIPFPVMADREGEIVGTNFERKYIAQGRPFYKAARIKYA